MADEGESYADRLVDEDALAEYLTAELGPAETVSFERHQEGHSNETLFLTWGDRDLVLRRPPAGETADNAHDVLREYRVIDALQGGDVPVPPTVLACDDESIIGSDFYVMERVDGTVIREEPADFTSDDRRRVGEDLIDTLAAIHATDHEAVGLGEFGYPEGFAKRQVKRWSEQFTWAFSKTSDEREVPVVYDLTTWLLEHAPEEHPHTLVHGDYKLDNVAFDLTDDPELVGVYDWEMSTLGDPRTDLGWLLSFWYEESDPPAASPGLMPTFTGRDGYPTRREFVDRWEDATGYEYEHDRFYRTLAVYKLAALGEMFFARYLSGDSDDDLYPRMREEVPALADRAMEIAQGDRPL